MRQTRLHVILWAPLFRWVQAFVLSSDYFTGNLSISSLKEKR